MDGVFTTRRGGVVIPQPRRIPNAPNNYNLVKWKYNPPTRTKLPTFEFWFVNPLRGKPAMYYQTLLSGKIIANEYLH